MRSERWKSELEVTADDDDAMIKCVATVPGLQPTIAVVHLHVHCESVRRLAQERPQDFG